MSERNYYVMRDDKCLFPAMTKEQTLTAIQQAMESGTITDVDTGFITTIKTQTSGEGLKFAVCTQAEYNALVNGNAIVANCLYIISDEKTLDELKQDIADLQQNIKDSEPKVFWIGNNTARPYYRSVMYKYGVVAMKDRVYFTTSGGDFTTQNIIFLVGYPPSQPLDLFVKAYITKIDGVASNTASAIGVLNIQPNGTTDFRFLSNNYEGSTLEGYIDVNCTYIIDDWGGK